MRPILDVSPTTTTATRKEISTVTEAGYSAVQASRWSFSMNVLFTKAINSQNFMSFWVILLESATFTVTDELVQEIIFITHHHRQNGKLACFSCFWRWTLIVFCLPIGSAVRCSCFLFHWSGFWARRYPWIPLKCLCRSLIFLVRAYLRLGWIQLSLSLKVALFNSG